MVGKIIPTPGEPEVPGTPSEIALSGGYTASHVAREPVKGRDGRKRPPQITWPNSLRLTQEQGRQAVTEP